MWAIHGGECGFFYNSVRQHPGLARKRLVMLNSSSSFEKTFSTYAPSIFSAAMNISHVDHRKWPFTCHKQIDGPPETHRYHILAAFCTRMDWAIIRRTFPRFVFFSCLNAYYFFTHSSLFLKAVYCCSYIGIVDTYVHLIFWIASQTSFRCKLR